jgi:hypothetical protein
MGNKDMEGMGGLRLALNCLNSCSNSRASDPHINSNRGSNSLNNHSTHNRVSPSTSKVVTFNNKDPTNRSPKHNKVISLHFNSNSLVQALHPIDLTSLSLKCKVVRV